MTKKLTNFLFILIIGCIVPKIVFGDNFNSVDIEKAKSLEANQKVKVQGIVIVEPDVLSSQFFYLNGIQIYSYKKDFPQLSVGDEVSVQGIISKIKGETRIKTATKNDIKVLNRGMAAAPQIKEIKEINFQSIGYLIKISGKVIERTGTNVFINDNTGEILAYFKQYVKIDLSKIKEGDVIEITGILAQNNDTWRLLPRLAEDIKILSVNQNIQSKPNLYLLGSTAKVIDFQKLKPYFIASSVVLLLALIIFLIIKNKQK
ncbi:MAG: hypothetical protein PHE59_00510 [Patescibacteria group bacterium]|nr:hypothetical protein [Patescibacteria group bacterium]MDD5164799.1 hypothetical protein [Patescibacteria group bacterium]MDD5534779.1 hypothetical protein [Patescibacteria group bacterium]